MDDIDREIQKAKIGKKDEPLRGWDHIRKPVKTDLPPMQAIRKSSNIPIYSKYRYMMNTPREYDNKSHKPYEKEFDDRNAKISFLIGIIILIIIAKLLSLF